VLRHQIAPSNRNRFTGGACVKCDILKIILRWIAVNKYYSKGGFPMIEKKSSRLILKVVLILVISVLFFVTGSLSARQSHMKAALNALRNARSELEMASANKGGHRRKAIDLVNRAITEVKKGIQYAQ
jgi:hypothetical protein